MVAQAMCGVDTSVFEVPRWVRSAIERELRGHSAGRTLPLFRLKKEVTDAKYGKPHELATLFPRPLAMLEPTGDYLTPFRISRTLGKDTPTYEVPTAEGRQICRVVGEELDVVFQCSGDPETAGVSTISLGRSTWAPAIGAAVDYFERFYGLNAEDSLVALEMPGAGLCAVLFVRRGETAFVFNGQDKVDNCLDLLNVFSVAQSRSRPQAQA